MKRREQVLKISSVCLVLVFVLCAGCTRNQKIPAEFSAYISDIGYGRLGGNEPDVSCSMVEEGLLKVSVSFDLKDTVRQDDWQLIMTPAFVPKRHWASHLTPTDDHIIAQHVFRSPALIAANDEKLVALIPDLDLLKEGSPVDWYMDMDAGKNRLVLGLSESAVREHVLFVRNTGAVYPPGKVEFGYYLMISDRQEDLANPWRRVCAFFWDKWGTAAFRQMFSDHENPEKYVKHTYHWAFDSWKDQVWQEFELNGKKVGAPVFIVNTTQSPNYPGEVNEREFRSVWNQAWFSSLRSASGLYRYARRTGDSRLMDYALKTKELALLFPQKEGFFPGLIATEMQEVELEGKKYNRSRGWKTFYFGNSNRNPYTWDARVSPLHVLDMSFTANQMLLWYNELEKDHRLLDYSVRYAEALLARQDAGGFFPGWLHPDSLEPMDYLNQSPESSVSVTFLLNLYQITKKKEYLEPALKAMDAIAGRVIADGQWEDFETYWSCSRYGSKDLVGKKVERNNQFKQNTLSIYWTAEALLKCYKQTGDLKYLRDGERVLDELLMYQAVWQPPYIYIRAIGGFGVMNADAEWNDSRQSLFAGLIVDYGMELGRKEYVERGLAALYASFQMMYCPENPQSREQWEKTWSFFNEKDYGFMMENYGHGGMTGPEGIGIGGFTIYDWGNGAAAEAYNRFCDHYGTDFTVLSPREPDSGM